jgi:hypothetical protein
MVAPRVYLGGDYDLGGRRRVYALTDALEVDENSFVQIERSRVYFEDVLAVTYHRIFGAAFLVFNAIFTLGFALIGLLTAMDRFSRDASIVFFIFASPFLMAFLVRLIFRVDVITVFGRRTKARMRYGFRKGRAREVFGEIVRAVRRAQEEASRQAAAQAPPAEDVPLAPPPPASPEPPPPHA